MLESRALRAFAGLASVAVFLLAPFVLLPAESAGLPPWTGIRIEGDAGFTQENGVTAGSGTAGDPYVIEGWRICNFLLENPGCMAFQETAITVRNTSAHLVIRNVTLQGWPFEFLPECFENGITLENASNVRIENAVIANWVCGLFIDSSRNVTVTGNKVYGSLWLGAYVKSSTGVAVHGNVFVRNGEVPGWQAAERLGMGNVWDAGYPEGGNYWSDYAGADDCRGPLQDDCTAPDGIGDVPHAPDVGVTDRYPLVRKPALPTNAPPEARFLASPEIGDVNTTFVVNASLSWDIEDAFPALEVRWDWEGDGTWDTDWSPMKEAQYRYPYPQRVWIRLEVRDSQGATAVGGGSLGVCRVVDYAPPAVVHEPIKAARVGESITVVAAIRDPCGIDQVRLYYRDVAGAWSSFSMSSDAAGAYVGVIPAQGIAGIVSYVIEASDFSGAYASTGEHSVEVRADGSSSFAVFTVPAAVATAVALCLWGWRRRKRSMRAIPPEEVGDPGRPSS